MHLIITFVKINVLRLIKLSMFTRLTLIMIHNLPKSTTTTTTTTKHDGMAKNKPVIDPIQF